MSIQSIGNRPEQAMLQHKQPNVRGKSWISQEPEETIKAKAETAEPSQVQQSEERGKGVVGLLQEGHFKGVADVRLRINFYDQLQLSATDKAGEALATGSQELVTNLESKVQELGGDFQIGNQDVEDLMTAFHEAANVLIGGIQDGQLDSSAVLDGLGDAFQDLIGSLQDFAPATAGEDAGVDTSVVLAEEPAVAEVDTPTGDDTGSVTDTEPTAFTTAIQSLQDWFDTELETLGKSVGDLQALPPLSEPRGNGVAYNRFLEIYKELEGETVKDGQESTTTEANSIETKA